jgi:hypothetical protein
MRFLRRDRLVYDFSTCALCGTAWGSHSEKKCARSVCAVCGTAQCQGNGARDGTCAICYVGLLPGWSHPEPCRCRAAAQAVWHKRSYCLQHLPKTARLEAEQYLARRGELWEEVADGHASDPV